MGLRIERDAATGDISGVAVTPEMPDALATEEALLTVILDPSEDNLESGARHSDARVRWTIALHPKLSQPVADALARDENPDVLRALASNPMTPTRVLHELGQVEDLTVANTALRALVARLQARLDQQSRAEHPEAASD